MKEIFELRDSLTDINVKATTLHAICDMLFSNLTQKIDSKSEEMLYIYNYERNRALINIIVDGLCDIKKLSQEI